MASKVERLGSTALLAICVAYVAVATRLPSESPNVSDVGPRLYPLSLGILMVALSAVWVGKSFRKNLERTGGTEQNEEVARGEALVRVISLVAVSALFPLLMNQLGFVVTASLFLFASILIVAWRRPTQKSLVMTAAVALACAFTLKWLFSDVMSIYLP